MGHSASTACQCDVPTCRERRPDGLGESRMREIRTSGLTSGDRKRSHVSPDCGGGVKASPTTHREATATAPVLDSTEVAVPVDGAIQVDPAAAYLQVCLIHMP